MIQSFHRRSARKRNTSRDFIGILLALLIGMSGQFFVFLLPDPLAGVAPKIPMLSPQDWPGSFIATDMFISEPWMPWKEKRVFFMTLGLNNDLHTNAIIDQTAAWYADTMATEAAWNQIHLDPSIWEPVVAANPGNGKPASRLFCVKKEMPDSPHECTYFAYWEHWYTEVHFWSQFDEDLQLPELQHIAARVNRLLMSALAEPCYGSLCTSELENEAR
jgi:hypothetical protein